MIILFIVTNIFFNESAYTVNENDKQVQFVLALSNQLLTDITIQVLDDNNTALGE